MKKIILISLAVCLILLSFIAFYDIDLPKSDIHYNDALQIEGELTVTVSSESAERTGTSAHAAYADAFMKKYPNVTVKMEEVPYSKYTSLIGSGEMSDVFTCSGSDAKRYAKDHNAIMKLNFYMDVLEIDIHDVYSSPLISGVMDRSFYMIPCDLNQQVLIYNSDALKQANISIPTGGKALEWNAFKDICKRITLEENGVFTQVGACFKLCQAPVWQAFAEGFGGVWVDPTNKKVTFVSDYNVMQGINELIEALNEGWLKCDDILYAGTKGDAYSGLSELDYVFRSFSDLQCIAEYGEAYENAGISWDFCPFPMFPMHKVGGEATTGYAVYNRTRNADAAAAFALFSLTGEGQHAYHSTSEGSVPVLKSLAYEDFWRMTDSKWSDKNFDAFVSYPEAQIPGSVGDRAPAEIEELLSDSAMAAAFERIINGQSDAETVFAELETKCNETWQTLAY